MLRILPELAPETDAADSQRGAEPFPLFDAMAAVLEAEVESGPLVLLLDDLHWVDPGSLRLLHYLVATALPPRVLVACGWRDHEADRATDQLRAELVRSAEPMPLRGLDVPDVAELVARSSGLWIDAEEAVALTSRTGGNPLFVTQVGRLAKVSGTSSMARLVPDSAPDLLRRRLARLSQPTHDLLSVAAVAGAATDLSLLAEVCDLGAPAMLHLLDEAQVSGLARVDGNRLVFVHELVRDALLAGVPAVRRREVHLAVAATLAPARGGGPVALQPRSPTTSTRRCRWVTSTRPSSTASAPPTQPSPRRPTRRPSGATRGCASCCLLAVPGCPSCSSRPVSA